ncbi:unnamed protein product [Dracunculus medinensis]|uniref:F5/8 type C domain-containing protein n=1 Tax=Dracunculus medinensis TaxID=318479 RepID=A0A0N4UHK5_DRAME|nr:unnamed protein product [Dracunculus medinensis]
MQELRFQVELREYGFFDLQNSVGAGKYPFRLRRMCAYWGSTSTGSWIRWTCMCCDRPGRTCVFWENMCVR